MSTYALQPNVIATDSLQTRLDVNARYGSFNFHEWILEQLDVKPGMDVLDVGCGTGIHALEALEILNGKGSVSAMDLSLASVALLNEKASTHKNSQTTVGDMKDLASLISNKFKVKKYDLAYSIYALWYCSDHFAVLDAMRKSLKPKGRLLVCTPNEPNGLREVIKLLGHPRPDLDQVTNFGPNVLEPYFRAYFDSVVIHLRRNMMRITNVEDVLRFYKSTGYYDAQIAKKLKKRVEMDIEVNGFFAFEKNVYLIEGVLSE